MTQGASTQSVMTPNSEDIDIAKLARRDENRPSQKLNALEMAWLHHHIIHEMFPLMKSDAGQWKDDYIRLIFKYKEELRTDDDMSKAGSSNRLARSGKMTSMRPRTSSLNELLQEGNTPLAHEYAPVMVHRR
jgi:hypothetical protein